MSRSAGPAAAAVLAALVLGVAWSGLVVGAGGAHLAGLCALALLPAAASLAPRGRPLAVAAALALSVPLVLALALRRPAGAHGRIGTASPQPMRRWLGSR